MGGYSDLRNGVKVSGDNNLKVYLEKSLELNDLNGDEIYA
jgi:hypothetical protein